MTPIPFIGLEIDHRVFVGRNLMLARVALKKRQVDWMRAFPTKVTTQGKLSQWEEGKYYPDIWFLVTLCQEYGLTMDWFFRGVRAGVAGELADDLRRVEAEILGASAEEAAPAPENKPPPNRRKRTKKARGSAMAA